MAQPQLAPASDEFDYAHPDDSSGQGGTWRDVLTRYNAEPEENPLGLLPAAELYSHPAYDRLKQEVQPDKLFILSAGWGLLPSTWLTPRYDITFSAQAEPYKRRRRADVYRDISILPEQTDAPMIFFGGRDYVPLFAQLTKQHRGARTVFYNSAHPPVAEGCRLERYVTTTRTNWHYECANAWVDGRYSDFAR